MSLCKAPKLPFSQIIVIGGTGQTGHRVLQLLLRREEVKLVATSRSIHEDLPAGPLSSTVLNKAQAWGKRVQWQAIDLEADAHSLEEQLARLAVGLDRQKPTALVLAAAFTNVEGCETDPGRCKRINESNTLAILKWALRGFGAKIVFYGTDYVFDGKGGPYAEAAPRNPISQYGRSKAAVEEWLELEAPNSLILRTTGVYDYLPGSKNFLMQVLEASKQSKPMNIPRDQFANPVWAGELGQATVELLARRAHGIFHVAGGSQHSRTEFASLISEIFGCDPTLIHPVLTRDLGQKALRPLNGGLLCEKLRQELGWKPVPAREMLEWLKNAAIEDRTSRCT